MKETMGQIIRRLRKERNLTQEELAEQLNVTPQAVSRWENETGMPDISQVIPLANVFGVSTDILFGKDGTDGEAEIEVFIRDIENKLSNRPMEVAWLDHYRQCCEDCRRMLEIYPNNYELLAYSIGNICCLVNEYRSAEETEELVRERQTWENECIRQANVILHHCTDSRYLNAAHKWLTQLYRCMGNLVKAKEHAKRITVFDPYEEGGDWLALVYSDLGKVEESRKQYAANIYKAQEYLANQLIMLGHSWAWAGEYEKAYACYRLYPDLFELMVGDGEDEIPFCLEPCFDQCALMCMRLGRPDEAMDWLEKMVRHQRVVAGTYNVITESKLPYLYGCELRYNAHTYNRAEQLTPTLAWAVFDPIRDTGRFRTILSDAEAFERGE